MRLFLISFIILFKFNSLNAVEFLGKFKQGSFILGKTNPKSKVIIDNRKIRVSKDGYFAFGLDRDRKNNVIIKIKENGKLKTFEKKFLKESTKFKELTVFLQNMLPLLLKFMKELKKITN